MKYQDNAQSVNGYYTGEPVGKRLADSLAPTDDGNDYRRGMEHAGTILGDAADPNFPEPETDQAEEEEED